MASLSLGLIILLTVILVRRRVDLGLILLWDAVLLGLVRGMPPLTMGKAMGVAVLEPDTLLTAGALTLILYLTAMLSTTGKMSRFMNVLSHIVGDLRLVTVLVPAFIGLLPIVGGALVSAPLVVEASDRLKLSPERRTFLNYWFRHLWEYFLPTYPGVLLSAALLHVGLGKIAMVNLPLTGAAILGGLIWGLYRVPPTKAAAIFSDDSEPRRWVSLLGDTWPLILTLGITLLTGVHLFYPLLVVNLVLLLQYRRRVFSVFRDFTPWKMALLVFAVIAFQGVLTTSGLVRDLIAEFTASRIPPLLILMAIPFLIGMVTGMTMAYVGVGFPLLLPIITAGGEIHWGLFSLAYAAGYSGVLLSPAHICLTATCTYYQAEFGRVLRLVIPPVGVVLAVALLLAYIQ